MQSLHRISRLSLYILGGFAYLICGVMLVAIAIGIKYLAIPLADKFLYNIIILGLLLQGIEIIELLNILVFALLGMGFGIATAFLHPSIARKVSASLLIIIVPIVFFTTPFFRYSFWLENIGETDKLSEAQVKMLTNSFLNRKVGIPGFLGFYVYTAQFPVLPVKQSEMNDRDRLERIVNSKIVQLTGVPPTVISWIMAICFWCIRAFYFAIAAIATIAHFREGVKLAKR